MLEMTLTIHGRVQGVGYRYSLLDAVEHNQIMVKGYIYNKPNGTVEIKIQGDIESLKDVRRIAVTGNAKSVIRDVEEVIQEINQTSYDTFSIKY